MVFVIGGLVTVGISETMNQKDCDTSSPNTTTSMVKTYHQFRIMDAPISLADTRPVYKNDMTNVFVGDLLILCSRFSWPPRYEEKYNTKYLPCRL